MGVCMLDMSSRPPDTERDEPLLLRERAPRALTHAFVDFDGTVSLLRSGWWLAMVDVALDAWDPEEDMRSQHRDRFIHEVLILNGKPPAFQLARLAELIQSEHGDVLNSSTMEDVFRERLGKQVVERMESLSQRSTDPKSYLVHEVYQFLNHLSALGITLHLVTGTDQHLVEKELRALSVDHFFGPRVNGPGSRARDFSKQAVFHEIMEREDLKPSEVLVVGDGFVEIDIAAGLGMPSIGIACDESRNGSGRLDQQRVDLLKKAQADIIVADFEHALPHVKELHLP